MRLVPFLLLLAACGPTDTVGKSTPYAIDAFARLDVSNVAGSVTISASDEPTVDATLHFVGETQPELETRLAGETLLVSTSCPEGARRCSVDLDIKVPSTADVDVLSLDGDVVLNGIGGVLAVKVAEGSVTGSALSGNTRLDVPQGDIELSACSGRLDLNAPEGLISATSLTSPTFDATSDREDLEVEFAEQPDIVGITTDEGTITLRVPNGSYDVLTTTRKGQVSVTGVQNTVGAGSVVLLNSNTGDIIVQGR